MSLFNTLVPTIPTKNIAFSSVLSTLTQSVNTAGQGLHVTALDTSITLSGTKPVLLELRPVTSEMIAGRPGVLGFTNNTTSLASVNLLIVRGAATPFQVNMSMNLSASALTRTQRWPPAAFWWLDTTAPAGVVNYQLWAQVTNCTFFMQGLQFVATEVI